MGSSILVWQVWVIRKNYVIFVHDQQQNITHIFLTCQIKSHGFIYQFYLFYFILFIHIQNEMCKLLNMVITFG
jgi:hypothetical protein